MPQSPNQFQQSTEKGIVDLKQQNGALPVITDGTLVPGQCVKIVDSADAIPHVAPIAADTEEVFGVVPYDVRRAQLVAGDRLEVMFYRGNVVYMESSAAIARGAKVMPVVAGQLVAVATTGKRIIGVALDKATGANQLIRVLLDLPGGVA